MYDIQRDKNIHTCTDMIASEVCATTEENRRGISSWNRIIAGFCHRKKNHRTLLQKRIHRKTSLRKRIIVELYCKKESL